MTANAKPSWMPKKREIAEAFALDYQEMVKNGPGEFANLRALISRAALDRAIEELESLVQEPFWDDVNTAPLPIESRIAALRAEREALP